MEQELNLEDIRPRLVKINKVLDENKNSGFPVYELINEQDISWLMEALEVSLDSFDRMEQAYLDLKEYGKENE